MESLKCPKCNGAMDAGLLVDAAPGGAKTGTWVKGDELPTIKLHFIPPSVEVTGERYTLTMYRCGSCGFVETYATNRP